MTFLGYIEKTSNVNEMNSHANLISMVDKNISYLTDLNLNNPWYFMFTSTILCRADAMLDRRKRICGIHATI